MRLVATILAVAALGGAAGADELVIGGLARTGCKVLDVKDCTVLFRLSSGRIVSHPVGRITSATIEGEPAFNRAEKLLNAKNWAEAIKAYDRAEKRSSRVQSRPWLKKLLQYRRLKALDAAAIIDRAVEDWLSIMERNKGSAKTLNNALDLRPTSLAKRGSEGNRKAIALLEARRSRVKNQRYLRAVRQLLMDLYQKEGRDKDAAAVAAKLAAVVNDGLGPKNGPKSVRPPGRQMLGELRAAEILIKQGQAGKALAQIRANLSRYRPGELPAALVLAGRAQMSLAAEARGQESRKLLIGAGLDFMRVVAFYPASAQAAEALYQAGRVNQAIGNLRAAGMAYRRLIKGYAGSDFVEKARAALVSLEGGAG